jgi:hypothetical protein
MNAGIIRRVLAFCLVLLVVGCAKQAPTDVPPESPQIEIIFLANPPEIRPGECAQVIWEALDAIEVVFDGVDVPLTGETEVCPEMTHTYELAVNTGENMVLRTLEVVVYEGDASPGEEAGGEGGQEEEPIESAEPHEPLQPGTPAYQAGTWLRLGGPPGGLGYDIRMQPDNPDIMYVTDANAGVHKSVDGGLTWFVANTGISADKAGIVTIFCLTIDPHDYNTVWAGTQAGGHIYRSTDTGAT